MLNRLKNLEVSCSVKHGIIGAVLLGLLWYVVIRFGAPT
jgi:hypothetical protein